MQITYLHHITSTENKLHFWCQKGTQTLASWMKVLYRIHPTTSTFFKCRLYSLFTFILRHLLRWENVQSIHACQTTLQIESSC